MQFRSQCLQGECAHSKSVAPCEKVLDGIWASARFASADRDTSACCGQRAPLSHPRAASESRAAPGAHFAAYAACNRREKPSCYMHGRHEGGSRMLAPHPTENPFAQVARLSDPALMAELQRLLRQERRVTARLLLHLGEIDARGLYRDYAYGSLFDYCVKALHLSEAEAFLRIRAARLGRQFPLVLDMLECGELHLSAISAASSSCTTSNRSRVQARRARSTFACSAGHITRSWPSATSVAHSCSGASSKRGPSAASEHWVRNCTRRDPRPRCLPAWPHPRKRSHANHARPSGEELRVGCHWWSCPPPAQAA